MDNNKDCTASAKMTLGEARPGDSATELLRIKHTGTTEFNLDSEVFKQADEPVELSQLVIIVTRNGAEAQMKKRQSTGH